MTNTIPFIPLSWRPVARAFARAGAEPPRRIVAGGFAIELACGMIDRTELLADAPAALEELRFEEEPLLDGAGNAIDVEHANGVLLCSEHRAVFTFIDHWQAGLFAKLTVYDTAEGMRRAVECL